MDLTRALKGVESTDEDVRQAALMELLKTNDIRVIPTLKKVASSDPSVKLRYSARKAIFLYQKLFEHDQSVLAAESPPSSPNVFTEGDGTSGVQLDPAILQHTLENGEPGSKIRMLHAAVRYSANHVTPLLRRLAPAEANEEVRATMVITLGILGSPGDVPTLTQFLDDKDPRVRANAIEGLGYIGHPSVYPHVLKHLSSPDNRIRANVIKVLQHYGKANLFQLLKNMLGSPEVCMRDSAAYALASLKGDAFLALLRQALDDVDAGVRQKAFYGLERFAADGVKEAQDLLLQLKNKGESRLGSRLDVSLHAELLSDNLVDLNHGDPARRKAEINRIVRDGDRDAVPLLSARLRKEPESHIRAQLVVALGSLGDSQVEDVLGMALDDGDPRVRANAIEALVSIRAPKLKDLVKPMLHDLNNRVKANAVVALKHEYDVNILTPLAEMVYSPEPLIRKSAFFALTDINDPRVLHFLLPFVTDPDPDLRHKAEIHLAELLDENHPAGQTVYEWIRRIRPDFSVGVRMEVALESLNRELDLSVVSGNAPSRTPLPEVMADPQPGALDDDEQSDQQDGPEPHEPPLRNAITQRLETSPLEPAPAEEPDPHVRQLFNLETFRHESPERKREILTAARTHPVEYVYVFLKKVEESEPFDIKVLARMALKQFKTGQFKMPKVLEKEATGSELASLLDPLLIEYRGLLTVLQLSQDLAVKVKYHHQNGVWRGPFGPDQPLLNALREDTQSMLKELIGDDEVEKLAICYYNERLRPFAEGNKSLDSNLYEHIVTLGAVLNRAEGPGALPPLMVSMRGPVYLLCIVTKRRVILVLRGPLSRRACRYQHLSRSVISRVNRQDLLDMMTLELQSGSETMVIPELQMADARDILKLLENDAAHGQA